VDLLTNMVVSPHHVSATMVEGRTHRMTEMIARLAPGATVDQARADVGATYARMEQDHPDAYDPGSHYRISVIPFKQAMGERARLTLMLLMGAALFVLIISAANVVNLTLMRGLRRGHELVLRAALGAGVLRLRRLLLVENLLLTLAGSVLGIVIALGGMGLLTSLAARYSTRAADVRLDLVVLGFALGLAVAIALLLSFVASLPKEGRFATLIAAGAQRIAGGRRSQRLQRGLVVAQVAVSVMLLAGAGLLTRTMIRLANADTGLATEQVLTMPVPLITPAQLGAAGEDLAKVDAAAKQGYEQIRRELRALPGVIEVGVGTTMPLRASDVRLDVKAEGRTLAPGEAVPQADYRTADPGYFRAAGVPLVKGREFLATDRAGGGRVAILNRTMADRLFPGEDPIGKRVAWTGDVLRFTPFSGDWRTVVGVVGNTQDGGPEAEPRSVMFMPFDQEITMPSGFVVRATSNVEGLAAAATRIVRRLAPEVPIEHVLTVSQIRAESVAPKRLNAVLVSLFGLLAVLIAAVGIGGVLAFSVGARTGEIGIRMSLGADGGRVQRMILGEGGALVALGLVLGVGGAWFAAQLIRGLLFGVAPHDPVTFGGVALLMAAIGLGACWIPAVRAARIDPAITMRS
jgi:predicted permease